MKDIKTIDGLAEQFDMSPTFIRKLKMFYIRMAAVGGIKQDEYKQYIEFCERFTMNIISKLKDPSQ